MESKRELMSLLKPELIRKAMVLGIDITEKTKLTKDAIADLILKNAQSQKSPAKAQAQKSPAKVLVSRDTLIATISKLSNNSKRHILLNMLGKVAPVGHEDLFINVLIKKATDDAVASIIEYVSNLAVIPQQRAQQIQQRQRKQAQIRQLRERQLREIAEVEEKRKARATMLTQMRSQQLAAIPADDTGVKAVLNGQRLIVVVAPPINLADRIIREKGIKYQNLIDVRWNEDIPSSCVNLAFEYSTGTSNIYNFKNVFLPISRFDSDGWIHKQGYLANDINVNRNKYGMIPLNIVFNYVLQRIPRSRCPKAVFILGEFMNRFGSWKQLQISASFGGPFWDTIVGKALKEFVLKYSVIEDIRPVEIRDELWTKLKVYSDFPESAYTEGVIGIDSPTTVRIDNGYRYYLDPTIVQVRKIPQNIGPLVVGSESAPFYSKANWWLTQQDALCIVDDKYNFSKSQKQQKPATTSKRTSEVLSDVSLDMGNCKEPL